MADIEITCDSCGCLFMSDENVYDGEDCATEYKYLCEDCAKRAVFNTNFVNNIMDFDNFCRDNGIMFKKCENYISEKREIESYYI